MSFIVTCAGEAMYFMDGELWSCSGNAVSIFPDRKSAHAAIRKTIRRTMKMIKSREIDDDNKFAARQCYKVHKTEMVKP